MRAGCEWVWGKEGNCRCRSILDWAGEFGRLTSLATTFVVFIAGVQMLSFT